MMDYTAGQSRSQGSAVENEPGAGALNQGRARTQTAGGVNMNISTGGPHVLLFERDQQFAALLGSELQLAGYECHTARTAVEVFDAIARYSIRLVLVNLAQAAAARREFWVALDTQRRGRGVQVLTFHCSNLAGYGPVSDDPDDRSHIMLADLEVDGMPGLVNMVNAIRSRITASTNGTPARPSSNPGIDGRQQGSIAANEGSKVPQTTMPLPVTSSGNGVSFSGRSAPTPPQSVPNPSSPPPLNPAMEAATQPRPATAHHTDKIRAVIYPNQRSWNAPREAESFQGANGVGNANHQQNQTPQPGNGTLSASASSDRQTRNEGTAWLAQNQPEQKESGLAQLSRMVQERHMPLATSAATNDAQEAASLPEITMPQQRVRPPDVPTISGQPLRASPIEDLPNDRPTGNTRNAYADAAGTVVRADSSAQGSVYQANQAQFPVSTLASIALPVSMPPVASMPVAEPVLPVSPAKQDAESSLLASASKNNEQAVPEAARPVRANGSQSQEQRLAEQLQAILSEQPQPLIEKTPKPAIKIGRAHV